MYNSIDDAETAFINFGWLEAVNLDKQSEIIEYAYRNDVSTESAVSAVDGWAE